MPVKESPALTTDAVPEHVNQGMTSGLTALSIAGNATLDLEVPTGSLGIATNLGFGLL